MSRIKNKIKAGLIHTNLGRNALFLKKQYQHKMNLQRTPDDSKLQYILHNLTDVNVFSGKDSSYAISKLLDHLPVNVDESHIFFYCLVPTMTWYHTKELIGNTTVDYSLLVHGSLNSLKLDDGSEYAKRQNRFVNALIRYANRVKKALVAQNKNELASCWENMNSRPAKSFFDAIQRILFVNQLLWQTGRYLNGLGSLDFLLYPYYEADLKNGHLTKEQAHDFLKEFCKILHQYYEFKSAALMGDIGQIILLGRSNSEGNYECNELTYEFIRVMEELKQPDPKVFLKVNKYTPDDLLKLAVNVNEKVSHSLANF